MKNKNKTLVYDDACPMCAWYTDAFVKTGLLDKEERKAFSCASPELLHNINWQRSKNEIPLLDTETGNVVYGIDALLEILGQHCAIIKTIGTVKPINWFLKKLYNFISYNRKVIVAKKTSIGKIDCTPDYKPFYRVLFMLVFLTFNTLMLFPIHRLLEHTIPFYSASLIELQLVHAALVTLNCLLAISLRGKLSIDYLGQVNMLALETILLFIPLMLINYFIFSSYALNVLYLLALTVFIFKEYFRRMDYAGIITQHRAIVVINLASIIAFIACLATL